MEICENKVINRLIKIFVLVALFFGSGYQIQYAVDTYRLIRLGLDFCTDEMFHKNGRLGIAIMYKVFSWFNLPVQYLYYFSYALAIVFLVVSVYVYASVLGKYIKNETVSIVLSFLAIANVYIIEYFMFVEKGGFILAILFNTLTIYHLQKYFSEGTKKNIVFAIIAELCAALTYQGTLALFFILLMPIIFKEAKGVVDYIKKFLVLVFVYWASVGLYIPIFFYFSNGERNGNSGLSVGLAKVIEAIKETYTTCFELVPKYLNLVMIVAIVVLSIVAVFVYKAKYVNILHLLLTIIVATILPTAPLIVTISWIPPRIIYPMASTFAVLLINYCINILPEDYELGKNGISKCVSIVATLITCCILVTNYTAIIDINNDKYKANFADRVRIMEIGQAIKEYEASTGYKIKQIAFYRDAHHDEHTYYPDINDQSDLVISCFHSYDSQLASLNYWLGTSYDRIPEDKTYEDYFAQLDWHSNSPMQIICDKDTLHYCVY